MGNLFRVECLKGKKKWLIQRYHWRVVSTKNAKIILSSEMYMNGSYVKTYSKMFANQLGADWKCLY